MYIIYTYSYIHIHHYIMLSTLLFIYTLILRTISRRGERRCVLEIHSTYVG